jgi:hypothetical protein
MMKKADGFYISDVTEVWKNNFQKHILFATFNVILYIIRFKGVRESSDGLSTSGFEKTWKELLIFFVSNHRDIVLDTTLLNVALFEHGLVMTASAIGDNLVQRFLECFSKVKP